MTERVIEQVINRLRAQRNNLIYKSNITNNVCNKFLIELQIEAVQKKIVELWEKAKIL